MNIYSCKFEVWTCDVPKVLRSNRSPVFIKTVYTQDVKATNLKEQKTHVILTFDLSIAMVYRSTHIPSTNFE